MNIYTVWSKRVKTGVNEKCLLKEDGNYTGVETGKNYSKEEYYHSKQFKARIISIDIENKTGMYHHYKEFQDDKNINVIKRLNYIGIDTREDNKYSWKLKYIGCYITVEKAHLFGSIQVYYCLELNDYFSGNEIEIIKD